MIPLVCPKCGHDGIRLHGTIYTVTMRPRFFLVGPMRYHRTVVGHDCSCLKCFYAFTSEKGRTIDAPAQTMHDAGGVNLRDKTLTEKQEREKAERKATIPYDADVRGDPRDRTR